LILTINQVVDLPCIAAVRWVSWLKNAFGALDRKFHALCERPRRAAALKAGVAKR
jgi:hypothetical protein